MTEAQNRVPATVWPKARTTRLPNAPSIAAALRASDYEYDDGGEDDQGRERTRLARPRAGDECVAYDVEVAEHAPLSTLFNDLWLYLFAQVDEVRSSAAPDLCHLLLD